jgi:hypothetical protein
LLVDLPLPKIDAASAWQQQHQQQQQQQKEVEDVLSALESTGVSRTTVIGVQRVQNTELWQSYDMYRQRLQQQQQQQQPDSSGINMKTLYHGTSTAFIDTIVEEGFDARLAKAASLYGRGTYFAERAETAMMYISGTFFLQQQKLIVASVVLGKQCVGSSGLCKPHAGYQSAYGAARSVTCFDKCHVVFDNHQAYPSYVVTLKKNANE